MIRREYERKGRVSTATRRRVDGVYGSGVIGIGMEGGEVRVGRRE